MIQEFVVKKSQIPGAGKGLFAKRDFKKGERILEYLGEIITDAECDRRAEEHDQYGYIFYINKKKCVDAYHTPEHLARYANDAKGLTKIKGLNNNCCYSIYKQSGWIKAEKNIKVGEEIFVSYGAEYWRDIRYNIKLDAEKAKDTKENKIKKGATKKLKKTKR